MLLKPWHQLPDEMKNEEVKKYYDILKKKTVSLLIKRLFDILVSIVLLIILSPILLILAICIKVDSKGPVFYRQQRITTNNKTFRIYKFRTMVQNADKIGTLVTVNNDSRITNVGNKIRKYRLDELPQVINVLFGDMTFVGTRPEVSKYVDQYTEEMMATLLLPAGITSLASIQFKDEDEILDEHMKKGMDTDAAYIKHVLPKKMEYNLEYLRNINFKYDIRLMFKTLFSVI